MTLDILSKLAVQVVTEVDVGEHTMKLIGELITTRLLYTHNIDTYATHHRDKH